MINYWNAPHLIAVLQCAWSGGIKQGNAGADTLHDCPCFSDTLPVCDSSIFRTQARLVEHHQNRQRIQISYSLSRSFACLGPRVRAWLYVGAWKPPKMDHNGSGHHESSLSRSRSQRANGLQSFTFVSRSPRHFDRRVNRFSGLALRRSVNDVFSMWRMEVALAPDFIQRVYTWSSHGGYFKVDFQFSVGTGTRWCRWESKRRISWSMQSTAKDFPLFTHGVRKIPSLRSG